MDVAKFVTSQHSTYEYNVSIRGVVALTNSDNWINESVWTIDVDDAVVYPNWILSQLFIVLSSFSLDSRFENRAKYGYPFLCVSICYDWRGKIFALFYRNYLCSGQQGQKIRIIQVDAEYFYCYSILWHTMLYFLQVAHSILAHLYTYIASAGNGKTLLIHGATTPRSASSQY